MIFESGDEKISQDRLEHPGLKIVPIRDALGQQQEGDIRAQILFPFQGVEIAAALRIWLASS